MKRDDVVEVLDGLRDVPAPDGDRQAAGRKVLLVQARQHRESSASAAEVERLERWGARLLGPVVWRRYTMGATFVAIVLAVVAGAGGVVHAADGAAPGDVLYGIDRAVESVRLDLTSDPETATGLLLEFAQERLLEAEELSELGDEENLEGAVNSYGETISSMAQTLGTAEGLDEEALASVLDAAFSVHEDQLNRIFLTMSEGEATEPADDEADEGEEGEPEDDETGEDQAGRCVGVELHPRGNALGESYEVLYEDVMTWFCDGYGFGEIMHALETSRASEASVSAEELLAMKTEMGGWGTVWQEVGLIGKPARVPDYDAPDDGAGDDVPDDEPDGTIILPDDAPEDDEPGGGPPEDKPGGGPPEDKPGRGPLEDKPGGGPPDDVPGGGPPDDKPNAPPSNAGRGRGQGRKR